MAYDLNRTEAYHREGMDSLGWELTVSNALEPPASPCRGVLRRNATYGALLYEFLSGVVPQRLLSGRVLEVGGGYGFLMRDLLACQPNFFSTMLDISPYLLGRQRETLRGQPVEYVLADFLDTDIPWLQRFAVAVLNENLGDFPTVCNLTLEELGAEAGRHDPVLHEVGDLIRRYGFAVAPDSFNFNLGAIQAVERLCSAGIRCIFLCEHSCEAVAPASLAPFIDLPAPGNPERIRLRGHSEFTITFSFLETLARAWGYTCRRGPIADYLPLAADAGLPYILTSGSVEGGHEIIRHFVYDLCKYEYLLLLREP